MSNDKFEIDPIVVDLMEWNDLANSKGFQRFKEFCEARIKSYLKKVVLLGRDPEKDTSKQVEHYLARIAELESLFSVEKRKVEDYRKLKTKENI